MSRHVSEQAADMLTLFAGRRDVYGGDEGVAIREPLTVELVEAHLLGTTGVGVYPCVHDGDQLKVRWGCCDIDTGIWQEARLLHVALTGMGIKSYIERSRSKGWHIWTFCDEWVPAATMRRALKCAYSAIGLPAKEANPKQERLYPHQLGNYVRLPYKGASDTLTERQTFTVGHDSEQDGTPIGVDEFFDTFEYTPAATLTKWAGQWFEPSKTQIDAPELQADDTAAEQMVSVSAPELLRFFLEGPRSGDRSQGLVGLVRGLAKKRMFTPAEIWSIAASADRRWCKYYQRPNWEDYISDVVSRGIDSI